jgi:hypothetical protein
VTFTRMVAVALVAKVAACGAQNVDQVTPNTLHSLACLGGVLGCSRATGPKTGFVHCVTLLVAGSTYQSVALSGSLAVVGLRLRVAGFAHDEDISICQQPLLELTSGSRE